MASQNNPLHFILLPYLAQGHLIPMIDMARLLSQHGVTVTIITTTRFASRLSTIVDRAAKSGLRIQLLQLPFPATEAGLPEGCDTMDSLPSRGHMKNFHAAIKMLQNPIEKLLRELNLDPSCIISDKNYSWADETSRKFQIPRLVFDGTSCFSLLTTHNIQNSKIYETVSGDSEYFVVPGLPDRIEFTKSQLPGAVNIDQPPDLKYIRDEIKAAESRAYGVVINTFEELEGQYVNGYRQVRGDKVWCIGPVSLYNKENSDKAERGDKSSIDETRCLKWLDSSQPGSVVYACLGSMSRLTVRQLIELGLGLEASNRPFIWVIRETSKLEELDRWFQEEGFEERIKGRGLIIRGWAPQVLILAHASIGGFLTHCGWNSTLEGVCAGVPMVTWPMFAEQFYNEKLIVQVLKIGLRIGVEFAVTWGEEEKFGVVVKKEKVKKSIEELMEETEDGRERRERAKKLGKKAKEAVEEGGSSYLNMKLLIQDIMGHRRAYIR